MQDVSKGEGRTVLFVSHNMAAVRSLCNRGIVLKDGGIDYIGNEINDTINHYLKMSQPSNKQGNKIVHNIVWHKSGFQITNILFNDTDFSSSTLESGKNALNIMVTGESDEDLLADLMVIIKNKDEVPMAALAEGHNKGILTPINKGKFTIKNK